MENPNILLVEGKDDLYVIADLLKYHLKIDDVKKVVNSRYAVEKNLITV